MPKKTVQKIEKKAPVKKAATGGDYIRLFGALVKVVESSRRAAVRSVNSIMTATYWSIGRRIVEHEQAGKRRAGYGEELLFRLSAWAGRFGRHCLPNPRHRTFWQKWPNNSLCRGRSTCA